MEHVGASRRAALEAIAETVSANTAAVLRAAARDACLPRVAARALALTRVAQAQRLRRFGFG